MSIAPMQLALVPMGNEQAFLDWLGQHAELHKKIQLEAVKRGFTDLGVFNVADLGNWDDWLGGHDSEHRQTAAQFNLPGVPDLTFLDLEDSVVWGNWHYAHALVHETERKGILVNA